MKFWTALQEPLSQAVLVDGGKVVSSIPSKPPGTPVRRVMCVGSFGDKLLLGRRNSIECWSGDGGELLRSYYHSYMLGLHELCEYNGNIIVGCAGLDVIFMLDSESNVLWEWWASDDGYCVDIKNIVMGDSWGVMQLSSRVYDFFSGESHLNSVRRFGDDLLISLLRNRVILKLGIGDSKSSLVCDTLPGVHSPIYLNNGGLVYGYDGGLVLPCGKVLSGYEWVKRVYELADGNLLFTHEGGITCVDLFGNVVDNILLPRPFGVSLFEF